MEKELDVLNTTDNTEEVTTEDVVTEEVTTEEVVAEEVATEDVVTEEVATEDVVTEEEVATEEEVVEEEVVPVEKTPMSKNAKLGIAAGVAVVAIAAAAMSMSGGGSSTGSTVEVSGYKGIEVESIEEIVVDDDYVNEYIEYVLSSSTALEAVDRAAVEGDVVNIDYVGTLDDVEFDGGTAEGYDLQLGSGSFIEGFEEQLIGAEAGEDVTVEVTFPEEYYSEDLAGQDVVFAVTVNAVQETITPELTDDVVVTLSYESTTVEEYLTEVRLMLEEDAVLAYEEGMKSQVWTTFIDSIVMDESDYPAAEIAVIEQKIIDSVEAQAVAYGMELSEFVASAGMDDAAFDEYVVESAKQEYLMQGAVLFVAQAEGLGLSQEEMDAEIYTLVTQAGFMDVAAANEAGYTTEDLELNVLTEIVVTWLTDNATVVEADTATLTEEIAE